MKKEQHTMRIFLSISWLWSFALFATAQILPEEKQSFNSGKFLLYTEHTDSFNGIHYQIVTHNIGDSAAIHLPIYLRIERQGTENYYFLDTKYDPDMFSFPALLSDRLAVIKGRYEFYIYDIQRQTLSRKLHPGLDQYEGEDAISGLFSGLTLFDNEQFLLGNVQGFGIFCYDISNPSDPTELLQYTIHKTGVELPFYAFFYKSADNLFDMFIAQADTSSKSYIPRLYDYDRLKNIRYAAKGISVDIDKERFPMPQPAPPRHDLPEAYFSQILPIHKHVYIGKTDEFCSREVYEYENGIRHTFTDYGPCEQCGHVVTEIFIPNFNITQALMFTLILYGYRNSKELYLEQVTDKEIRLLWELSEIKIVPHENGVLIIDDVMS